MTQTTTSVANTLPGGGAIAIGLTYSILHSWGFTGTEVALYVGVSGIWNIFMKLALPVLSVVFLVHLGAARAPAFISAALIGLAVLAGAVVLLAAVFKSEALARRVGNGLGRVLSAFRRVFHKPPVTGLDDRAAKFRADTIDLVPRRWIRLTWTTLLSHLALFFILLLCLRHLGVSEQEVSSGPGVRRLLVRPADLGAPDHARRARRDRARIHRRAGRGRRRRSGRRRGRPAVPHAHVRHPDPARRVHLPDLAGEEELARAVPEDDELQASAAVSG